MPRPHPALIEIAAGRPPPSRVDDPGRLLTSAFDHRMQGLVWSAVMRGDLELPLRFERQFAAIDLRTQSHHRRLWAALGEITEALDQRSIYAATFKGVTAESRWYSRLGERPSRDLDLWLSPYQIAHIDEAIEIIHPGHPLSGKVGEYFEQGHLQSVDLVFAGIRVDLHFDPVKAGFPTRQREVLWRTLMDLGEYRVLSGRGSALVSGIHLLKDGFSELGSECEFARLVMQYADAEFWHLASSEGLDRWISFVVSRVEKDLGIDLGQSGHAQTRLSLLPVFRAGQRLKGTEHLEQGTRLWYIVPLTASGRWPEARKWLQRKLSPPPALAGYNLNSLRGSWLFRLVRGSFLSRRSRNRDG